MPGALDVKVEVRVPQPYVAHAARLARRDLGEAVPALLARVYLELQGRQIKSAGAPLIRYLVVDDDDATVEIQVGVPVAPLDSPGGGPLEAGLLPRGSYATVLHRGPYDEIVATTARLLEWGRQGGRPWAVEARGNVTSWRGRVERYLVGPAHTPDVRQWRTEVAVLLRDSPS